MGNQVLQLATDWWIFGATIFAGILTALTTMGAVIYTNRKTIKQLKEQNQKFELDKKEQNELNKMVVVKPRLMLNTFYSLLETLLIYNIWDRYLLFSGDEGFDFFENTDKRAIQQCRFLLIDNKSVNDIRDVKITTNTILLNVNNDEKTVCSTENYTSFLRSNESIGIRIANQQQYEKIIGMNKDSVPSNLVFECTIEYSTLASQRVCYLYKIVVKNDRNIEVIQDGIECINEITAPITISPTTFRNLQDYISPINRVEYYWEKMGQSQMRGLMSQMNTNSIQQNIMPATNGKSDGVIDKVGGDGA